MSGLGPGAKRLIEAGRKEPPMGDERRARNRLALAARVAGGTLVGGGVGTATVGTANAVSKAAATGSIKLGLMLALLGVASSFAAWTLFAGHGPIDRHSPQVAPSALVVAAAVEPPVEERPAVAPVAAAVAIDELPPLPALSAHRGNPAPAASVRLAARPTGSMVGSTGPAAVAVSVAEDAQLLQDVDAALRRGDRTGAQALLDARATKPAGALEEEREAAGLLVACGGAPPPSSTAIAAARRFATAHAGSPLVAKVLRACAPPAESP
jgi:hypothetical protein